MKPTEKIPRYPRGVHPLCNRIPHKGLLLHNRRGSHGDLSVYNIRLHVELISYNRKVKEVLFHIRGKALIYTFFYILEEDHMESFFYIMQIFHEIDKGFFLWNRLRSLSVLLSHNRRITLLYNRRKLNVYLHPYKRN